jgi:peptidyl-prolyl cis-trans isomerase C
MPHRGSPDGWERGRSGRFDRSGAALRSKGHLPIVTGLDPLVRLSRRLAVARILKDPLLHFMLIGAGIFVFFRIVGDDSAAAGRRIVVPEEEIGSLAQTLAMLSGEPPGEADLRQLVEPRIREEVLYREALALGLDRDDSQIRQRLVEKMTFLTEDLHSAAPPDDAEIADFYAANPALFEEPATRTFEQIYFSPSENGSGLMAAAQAGLERLRSGEPADRIGNAGTLAFRFDAVPAEALRRDLGQDFADAVFGLATDGAWHGPIRSFFGAHLVRVVASTAPRLPPLEAIRGRVESALDTERRRRANEAAYRELRARYDVVVEIPEELRHQWQSEAASD